MTDYLSKHPEFNALTTDDECIQAMSRLDWCRDATKVMAIGQRRAMLRKK